MNEIKQEWFQKDYYKVLEVPSDASEEDIAKSYRNLARKYHPDKNSGDPSATERFKEITGAYDVLGDSGKRKQYDEARRLAAQGMPFGSTGPRGSQSFQFSAGGGLGDLFDDLLRGNAQRMHFGGARSAQNMPFDVGAGGADFSMKGSDLHSRLTITFEEAVEGATLPLKVGSDAKQMKVRVPPGVADGQQIRLKEKGAPPSVGGGRAGDLYVTVRVRPHPLFGRDGNDLTLEVPVSLSEAALGAKVMIPTFNGSSVSLRIPSGTQSGQILRVRGRGLRLNGKKGDLFVTVKVVVPSKLTSSQKRALEQFADASNGVDLREHLGAT